MGGSPATPQFEIAAPEFEISPPTPKLRPEDQVQIDKAIRSVPLPRPDYMQTEQTLLHPIAQPPTPVSPEAEQYQRDLRQPKQRPSAADLAATAAEMFTVPSGGAASTEQGVGTGVKRHLTEVRTPGQRVTGAMGLASDISQTPVGVMGPAALEAGESLPAALKLGAGFLAGLGASKGAGKIAPKLGANEEQTQLAQDLAFWMPTVAASLSGFHGSAVDLPEVKGATIGVRGAGAGVALTPESVNIGGRVGPFKGSVSIPRNGAAASPALEPPTIEGSLATDPSSQMLAEHELKWQRAGRVVNGQPPVEPPPAPPTPKVTEITQDDIQHIAGLISKLPPQLRAQGLLEAHQTMARILQSNGKVVGPDGKLMIIDSPKAAEKAAADMVNNEVERLDKLQQESEKSKPSPETKGTAQSKAEVVPSNRRGRRAQQAEIEAKAFQVSEPEAKFEVAAPEKPAVESAGGSTENSDAVQANETRPTREGIGEGRSGVATRIAAGSLGDTSVHETGAVDNQGATGLPASANSAVTANKPITEDTRTETQGRDNLGAVRQATGEVATGSKPTAVGFQKGQQVRFSKDFSVRKGQDQAVSETIPQGTTAFVEHAGEGMNFVRLRLADGRKVSVNQRNIEPADIPADLKKRAVEAGIFKSGTGPEPGEVGTMKVSDLKMAPNKFQYKLGTDAEGVSSLLKEQDKYKPDLAGVVSVWRDPSDGQMYVVNGHHRFELAKRTGQKEIAVRHIQATDAKRARSIGALQNIAEGRGTPVDAAKFFRDSSVTPEDLKKEGISLGEATAKNGMALSRLDTPLFNKVVSGDLRLGRAVAIGEATEDPAEQKAILNLVDKKEARGQKISDGVLSELIRFVKESGREKETKAEVSDYIRQQLSKDRKLFGFVAKEGRAEELSRAGNKIDVGKSKEISIGAAQAEEVYNRLSARGGEIADILDKSAKRLAGKENAASVKSEAYRDVREAVRKALAGGEVAGTRGREGLPGRGGEPSEAAKPASERKDTVSLFHSPESLEEPAPIFYSKAQRVALEKVPNSAPGGSILATLKNNGVKEDEIKWLGLDDFLRGKFHVTKKELMKHIAENNLQVAEVTKGEGKKPLPEFLETNEQEGKTWITNEGSFDYRIVRNGPANYFAERTQHTSGQTINERFASLEAAKRWFNELRKEGGYASSTKYSQYTLPGEKRNYTELLLTLPERTRETKPVFSVKQSSNGYDWHVVNDLGGEVLTAGTREYAERRAEELNAQGLPAHLRDRDGSNNFRSSHFDESNILAHVRFDDRTDSDGKKTLLVEEVQSDWHQKGKKEGYQQAVSARGWTATETGRGPLGATFEVFDSDGKSAGKFVGQTEREAISYAVEKRSGKPSAVPDAPFKTDWHELAMKRMLRYAAENGYDKLAWVTGQQTADRYDLTKQINSVLITPYGELLYTRPGQTEYTTIATEVTPEELPNYIGKEPAQKLLSKPANSAGNRFIDGLDLKVGGEWAKRLYDQAIPNFVNKVAKKWGAKVGDTEINSGKSDKRVLDTILREDFGTTWGDATQEQRDQAIAIQDGTAKAIPTKVHSVDITPQMQHSVVYEGQPLFANDGFSLIRDRSAQAWATIAKAASFEVVKPAKVRSYLRLNRAALQLAGNAFRANVMGGSVPPNELPEFYERLEKLKNDIEGTDKEAGENVGKLLKAMKDSSDETAGLTFAPDIGNPEHELRVLHEEQFHAMVQSPKYEDRGVPWREMVNDPGVMQMADRITLETRSEVPIVIVAEAMADIAVGDARELSAKQAYSTASHYYELVAEKHGAEPLDAAQQVYDYIDQEAHDRGMIPADGRFNAERTKPGRQALADVRQRLREGKLAPRGGSSVEKSETSGTPGGSDNRLPSTGGTGTIEGQRADTGRSPAVREQLVSGKSEVAEPARAGLPVSGVGEEHGKLREEAALSGGEISGEAKPGELREGAARSHGNGELLPSEREASTRTTEGTPAKLGSTQPVGLTDEELATWSKSKNFHIEPAGEQGDLFGEPKKIFRVSRNYGGEYQTGLVYEDQLQKAGLGTDNQQESLFHALHKDERGELDTGQLAKAAGTVSSFLKQEVEDTRRAKELQWEMYDLDKRHEGRVLRAKQLLEKLQEDGVTQEDRRAIDNHLDALEADSDSVPVPSLTEKQDEILDKVLLPLKEEAEAAFKKVTEGGMTIPNYNPRQTKGKGGMLDRFLSKQGQRWSGRANLLSKQMPAAKHRVMMALELENPSRQGSLLYKKGDRVVVSLKGGQVTAWKDGQPENLGGISMSDEGRVFEDKDGNIWNLKQATKNEIEKDSGVRYYHDAAASTIVNWLQAKKAEAAYDFLENFKHSEDFDNIAMKTGEGNPQKGWRTTNLPQFKGYYFEPYTAEVFDWFFDRLKSGDPDAFGAINSFMRARILLNPLKHPINIAAHAFIQRGVSGFLPSRMYRLAKTGARAINTVWNQNQDYLDALEAGAPLQSAHDATRDLVKLFYEQMADAADQGEPWATKAAKAIGFPPTTLVHLLHKLSSKIAWPASDMMFLQAAYEYQDTHPGVSLKDSFREVGRIIPEYRLPVRILNSTTIGKIMGSKWGTIFGSYHYGELRAFSESLKSAFGAGEAKEGQSKAGDVAKGWDRLAMMALGMVLLGGAIRKLVQEVTGEKDAEPAYPGVFGLLHAADRVAHKEETPTQAMVKVVTPNPATMLVTQLAFNRDFATGRHIYDPAAKWDVEAEQLMHYLKENVSPMGSEIERAGHTDQGWKKLAWNQLDVNFPKHGAMALAQQIASSKFGTAAMSAEDREKYYARQKAIQGMRNGDDTALDDARAKGLITSAEARQLHKRARKSEIEDKVHDFTEAELRQVYDRAVVDGEQETAEKLARMMRMKRRERLMRHLERLDSGNEAVTTSEPEHAEASVLQ